MGDHFAAPIMAIIKGLQLRMGSGPMKFISKINPIYLNCRLNEPKFYTTNTQPHNIIKKITSFGQ